MKAIDGQAPQALTTVLFLTFVFIGDADGGLTSREVERLNKLIGDPKSVDDALLREALAGLGTHYTALWKVGNLLRHMIISSCLGPNVNLLVTSAHSASSRVFAPPSCRTSTS